LDKKKDASEGSSNGKIRGGNRYEGDEQVVPTKFSPVRENEGIGAGKKFSKARRRKYYTFAVRNADDFGLGGKRK